MSGDRVTFVGDAMAAVGQGIIEVRALIGQPPVIVGGLAALARLSNPCRATVDLDIVDRVLGHPPQLELPCAADGAEPVEPAAVLLPTPYGAVKGDVLEMRQVEIDQPSEDPGDRLHASAHAWANDSATDLTIEVVSGGGDHVEVTTSVAEPGPLIAIRLQAVMNRSVGKQGTDLGAGGPDVTIDDLELVAELLGNAARRTSRDSPSPRIADRPTSDTRCMPRALGRGRHE